MTFQNRSSDILGGARYNGISHKDSKRILDLSQNGKSHPDMEPGHPRGHASYPQASGPKDSVENYSKIRNRHNQIQRKTGFLSRSDQDFVAHYVLKNNAAQDAMEILNHHGKRALKEVVKLPATKLWIDERKLPKVQYWYKGEKFGNPGEMSEVVVVMKHFYEKYDDDKADVFVVTLYPRL
ncbi:uncharacterized protein LOC131667478 [Phymastichus coffea]|uniref:uncharacterized protein LOC131667478 n=1 Tax=Phymastichus coffea TaxID=108790 RepID=UPI00273B4991|nr:uncharacterized protein LOC131667478 [Phymastichus coffea]